MLTIDELPDCPIATTVRLIGNKWKILIIRDLLARPYRFGEFQHDIPGISGKVLSENLKSLESDGLVIRTVYDEVPLHVEYRLSELGESLRPLLKDMETWGLRYQRLRKDDAQDS